MTNARRWCITPPRRADRTYRKGENPIEFLRRSTAPTATRIRRFVNGNLARMPVSARPGLCRALRTPGRFHETNLELILGRTLQELGATELEYEPRQASGKKPDYLATFDDGVVFADARHPDWNAELVRQQRAYDRLIEIIEEEIPPGWSFGVDRLPRIGLSQKVGLFRTAIRSAFTAMPCPAPGIRLAVTSPDPDVPFELELRAPRLEDWRAWTAGPGSASFVAPELRILAALKAKREQLRHLPHPAVVALGGSLGAGLDDYEIALFGRTIGHVDARGREVRQSFDHSGAFAKRGSGSSPTIAAVLAFTGMDLTAGRDPVLFLHPRFQGRLPAGLLRLEVRTLTPQGPRARASLIHGVYARLTESAAGR